MLVADGEEDGKSQADWLITVYVFEVFSRLTLVSGLKWVDEVIANSPYEITEEFMHRLFNEHKIDYIIHGDDPCLLPDGSDAYALANKAGRYKQIKRTEGVSSTDIVVTQQPLQQETITMGFLSKCIDLNLEKQVEWLPVQGKPF
nr:ethanolamine-phosphate cytidylyltransferase-like [Ipomoea batatas]GME19375.1 ethanolamine-phosphate cytidylyltransferase-like [Ipomoea batatas]